MLPDFAELLQRAREINARSGGSLRQLLEELDLTPENEEMVRSLLLQAGLGEEELANAKALVEQMVANLRHEERRQLAEVFSEVTAGRENLLPPEIKEFLRRLRQD